MQLYDVVVIGAGVAGLTAASRLKEMGITNFIVLEAQEYVGGRIKTSYEWGTPIELGAEFIHGDQTITAQIARQLSLDYISAYEDVKLVDEEGQVLGSEYKKIYYRLRDYVLRNGAHDISVATIIENNPVTDDETIKQLVSRAFADLEGTETAMLDSGVLKDIASYDKLNGIDIMLRDGYQQIIRYFDQDLPIKLQSPVSGIDYSNDTQVLIALASGERTYAKKVIVTVSLGVLKSNSITFIPSLPVNKQKAIDRLGMGETMKLILRLKDPKNVRSLFRYADGGSGSLQTITNWWASATDPKVLVGYCGGERSTATLGLPPERLVEKVLEDLGKMLGHSLEDDLEDYIISRWDDNQYILGSYSYHPIGAKMSDHEYLAGPVAGRLFWAGEATDFSGNYATVHGAILSGFRVAGEVAGALTHIDVHNFKHSAES